ncbi:hypothetical protein NL676_025064 [Syzygium grande]|nr:hypothetical protein NL676_025064 [Syzygium grande]
MDEEVERSSSSRSLSGSPFPAVSRLAESASFPPHAPAEAVAPPPARICGARFRSTDCTGPGTVSSPNPDPGAPPGGSPNPVRASFFNAGWWILKAF